MQSQKPSPLGGCTHNAILLVIAMGVIAAMAVAASAQVLLVSPQAPTLAPHDCPCKPECKCDPCTCKPAAKPVVSVKKHNVVAASVQVTEVVGETNYHGSGTVVDWKDGTATVVTCEHVVNHGGKVFVGWVDGKVLPATVQRVNARDDVALLTVKCEQVPYVPIASKPSKVGEPVLAYGFVNREKNGPPIHRGESQSSQITHLGRYERRPGIPFSNQGILGAQHQGRSGGGLFNAAGELIGVCSCDDPPSGGKRTHEGIFAGHNAIKSLLQPGTKAAPASKLDAIKTTPFFLQDCPSGQCPLVPKQALPRSLPAVVGNPAGVSPGVSGSCSSGQCRPSVTPARRWGRR